MGITLRLIVSLIAAVLSMGVGLAQADEPRVVLHYVDAYTNPPEVHAYLSAFDAKGNAMENLTAAVFAASEDNAPLTIAEVAPATSPIAVAIAIDTSGSMGLGSPSGIQAAKDAAVAFIDGLGPDDQVAVFAFNDQVSVSLSLTADHGAAKNAINQLSAKGDTTLYDACYDATSLVAKQQRGRRVVVLLTDGEDTKSKLKIDDCLKVAQDAAVPVYTIGLGQEVNNDAFANVLARIAKLSGAAFARSPKPDALKGIFGGINRALKTQYVLKYNSEATDSEHALGVVLRAGGQQAQDERKFRMPAVPPRSPNLGGKPNDNVQGKVSVKPFIPKGQRPIVKLEYFVDKISAGAVETPPFSWDWDTTKLSPGVHVLGVKSYDSAGLQSPVAELPLVVLAAPVNPTAVPVPTVVPTPIPPRPATGIDALLKENAAAVLVAALVVVAGLFALVFGRRRKGPYVETRPPVFENGGQDKTRPADAGDDGVKTMPAFNTVLLGRLVVASGAMKGESFDVYDGTIIGRSEACEICLKDNQVSGQHAEFHLVQGEVQIRDHSLNGTHIGTRRVQDITAILSGGESLRLGRTTLRFEKNVSSSVEDSQPLSGLHPEADDWSGETQLLRLGGVEQPKTYGAQTQAVPSADGEEDLRGW